MKWIIIILVVLVVLIAIMYFIGYFMPVKHVARISARFSKNPAEIWEAITNVKAYSNWRSGLKGVEVIDDRNWKETIQGDVVHYRSEIGEPGRRFISRIVNKDLPYGGYWLYELNGDQGATVLTITENGEVYNPLFRFMSRYIFGHDATLKKYESDLQNYLAKK